MQGLACGLCVVTAYFQLVDTGIERDAPDSEVNSPSSQPLHGAQPPEHPRQFFD